MEKSHPPKPRLTLRVGITGHRPDKLAPDANDRLRTGMKDLFQAMQAALAEIRAANRDVFSDEEPQLRAVSPLAEGADRIFAQAARELGIALCAPLPFRRTEYENDFHDEASRGAFRALLAQATVLEFMHERRHEKLAYETVGLFTLRQCDVVVTVWDGDVAAGRGGTETVLARALAAGIPIVRFKPDGDGPWILPWKKQAPDATLKDLEREPIAADSSRLHELIESIVAPPPKGTPAKPLEQRKRLNAFLRETEQRANYWFAFPFLQRCLTSWRGLRAALSPKPYVASVEDEWRAHFWTHFAGVDEGSTIEREVLARAAPRGLLGLLEQRYAWADKRAVHLAQVYRSSYVFIFMLGALTVACALLPVLGDTKPYSSVLELLLIGTATAIVVIGGRRAWHRRWLDYRQLAEQLRALRFLALAGANIARFRVEHADAEGAARHSWTDWYLRATVREIDMPHGFADGNYAMAIRRALVDGEIASQIGFHKGNAERQKSMEHWLDRLGLGLFGMTAVILIGHLQVELSGGHIPDWVSHVVTFFSALLPAFGAALFAIRVQGDFDESARLSEEMQERLATLASDIPAEKATNFPFMSRAVEEAAGALTADLSDWRLLYRGKPLQLNG